MLNESSFQTLDASTAQADFVRLVQRTARNKGRIEITSGDGHCCVIISKEELDSLERALEILSTTHDGQVMSQSIEQFAQLDGLLQHTVA